MPPANPLTGVAGEIASMFDALTQALKSPAATMDLLRRLGWEPSAPPPALAELRAGAEELAAIARTGIDDIEPSVLIQKVVTAVGRIDALLAQSPASVPVAGAAAFVAEFPGQLTRHLVGSHLVRTRPTAGAVLRAIGALVVEDVAEAPPRSAYQRIEFFPERFVAFLSDPLHALRTTVAWGQDPIDAELLADVAPDLLTPFAIETTTAPVSDEVVDHLSGTAAEVAEIYRSQTLAYLLAETDLAGVSREVGVGLAPAPPNGAALPGVVLLPFASAGFDASIALSETLSLLLASEVKLDGGLALVLRPAQPPQMLAGIEDLGVPVAAGELSLAIESSRADGDPIVLIGAANASRIEYRTLTVAGGGRGGIGAAASAFVNVKLVGSALVVKPAAGEVDSFLARLLPGDGGRLEFDLELDLDSKAGLTFSGGGGLEIRYPTHITLGPVELDGVTLAVRPAGQSVTVDAGADARGRLGPLTAVVENVGMSARFDAGAGTKNLGLLDVTTRFKPPTGVGLSIDAAAVRGGGYLAFDHAKGEYAGVLELTLAEVVSATAVGLVTTKQPDGAPGFSLLVAMSAEFTPGVQLGLGFTLVGVGGLVALNRTVRLDALAQGIRTGAAESILFPSDIVANAPRILSDLRTIFPQQQGTFVVGPMIKAGWGTPTLVTASLALIIEIPGNVAVLGVLKVALPTERAPLIELNVSFVGALEPDKQRAWFFASLFDSRILVYPIHGELGLLLTYGDDPNFVLSVGGFHPRFDPPALPFPTPQRVGFSILQQPGASIVATAYFAVTPNTAQFGARAEMVLGFEDFGVQGAIGFDALFRFSPFSFVIDASANFSLTAFGVGVFSVRIDATLEGPAPWHVRGRGSISLLFFDISADFDLTWGEPADTLAPPVAVLELVRAELAKTESWKAELPAGRHTLVTLRPIDAGVDLVLHPVGTLRVAQRAVPLGVSIQKVGAQRAADVSRVAIATVSGGLGKRDDAKEQFAMAQFQDMSDADKLSRRAYEPQPGGAVLGAAAALGCSRAAQRLVRYEQIVVDTFHQRFIRPRRVVHPGLFAAFVKGSAASTSLLSFARAKEMAPFADAVSVGTGQFVVADAATNRATDSAARFETEAEARDELAGRLAERPDLAGSLHVIPAFEAVET